MKKILFKTIFSLMITISIFIFANSLLEARAEFQFLSVPNTPTSIVGSEGTYTNYNKIGNDYFSTYTNDSHAVDNCLSSDSNQSWHEIAVVTSARSAYLLNTVTVSSDDPITNIIPKILFRTKGIHSYIGKNYGFFINTKAYNSDSTICQVLVYKISTGNINDPKFNGVCQTNIKTKITPVINAVYKYSISSQPEKCEYSYYGGQWRTKINLKEDGLVYKAYSYKSSSDLSVKYTEDDASNLYIGNAIISHSIENAFEINENDSGYNARQDKGISFGNRISLDYRGTIRSVTNVSRETEIKDSIFGIVGDALGFVSKFSIGTIVSIMQTAIDVTELATIIADNHTCELVYENSNNVDYKTELNYASGVDAQLGAYGKLIKQVSIGTSCDSNKQLLINSRYYNTSKEQYYETTADYYRNEALIQTNLQTEILLNIYDSKTNSYYGVGGVFSDVITSSISPGFIESISLSGKAKHIYSFIPNDTMKLNLQTISSVDTFIEIYDSTMTMITYNDDSGEGLNASLDFTFKENTQYYISYRGYSTTISGYVTFKTTKLSKDSVIININSKGSNSLPIEVEQSQPTIIKVTANITGKLYISTSGRIDTRFDIIKNDGVLHYNYDDTEDSINSGEMNYDAELKVSLDAGESIFISLYSYTSGNTNIWYSFY